MAEFKVSAPSVPLIFMHLSVKLILLPLKLSFVIDFVNEILRKCVRNVV